MTDAARWLRALGLHRTELRAWAMDEPARRIEAHEQGLAASPVVIGFRRLAETAREPGR